MGVQLAPLVERELELETVERLLAGARAGSGGAVVFEGPAGIGKSSLLAAARTAAAAADLRVLSARGASWSASCRSGSSGSCSNQRWWPATRTSVKPCWLGRGFPTGSATLTGGGAYNPASGFVHSAGGFRCTSDIGQGPLAGCLAGEGVRWDTVDLRRSTSFKCTGATGEWLAFASFR